VSPGHPDDDAIRAGAQAAAEIMREAGAEVEVVPTSGTPAVIGRFRHPRPVAKLLCYAHLDVQPADPEEWMQPDPFELVVQEHPDMGFLYRGRGATDDKGPALCALRAASLVAAQELPIDIDLLWETEEETGSDHLDDVLAAKHTELACDAVIVSDTIWTSAEQPAISVGLRGVLTVVMRLRTARRQAHSGLVGGVARNPVRELCEVVSAIHRATFWREGMAAPHADEVTGYLAAGVDVTYFKEAHGLDSLETEVPLDMLLRLWTRPTFEVHGLVGGHRGPGVKTIVPHEAELKASFRLVPNQDPRQIAERLREFVRAMNPDVEVETPGELLPYCTGSSEGRVHETIVRAMAAAFGRDPILIREGGSIGAVPLLNARLGAPIHFLPLSLPQHGYHAPDEYFDWRQARGGMEALFRVFAELAR
jgi:acetylornithine deacetylase/succinyl-diaminopimelate desuccinylase-like protein